MKSTRHFLVGLLLPASVTCVSEESCEAVFHRTVQEWQVSMPKNDWSPWQVFTDEMKNRFENADSSRLEIVGALEEGILAIERVVFTQGQGENPPRDVALSKLYGGYADALMHLTPKECLDLALDPHTLLIGAETVDKNRPEVGLCMENAENSLRNAVSLDATNMAAENLLQEMTGEDTVHKRKPKEFVAELFDSFADSFDEKLLKNLQYKVPGIVGALASRLSNEYISVLDAGCGTGLAGRYLRSLVPNGPIVGVDASQKMLDKAATCTRTSGCGLDILEESSSDSLEQPLYDGLVQMDLEDMTIDNLIDGSGVNNLEGFDLVVAADVLVYFGKLDNLLATFAKLSTTGGRLIFSCELATAKEAPLGWRLLPSGRFAHTKQHAVESASVAGYGLVFYEEITPRMEKGEEVKGHLFAFEKSYSESEHEL